MTFSSIYFTFLFLPIVLGLYFVVKANWKNYILLLASLAFYAYGEPKFVLTMMILVMADYVFALIMDYGKNMSMRKCCLFLAVTVNLSILFVFKYLDLSIRIINKMGVANIALKNIVLPIGISFFIFQALSYVVDVYHGTVKAQKNPLSLALYVTFFPQLVAGPIVRYNTIVQQIEHRIVNLEKFGYGAKRFICGFAKKVIIANNLSVVAEQVFSTTEFTTVSTLYLWMGSICYSLQILYDFSGYSDMAIGLGKMFGFDFEENFNCPYISKTITEFWHRWHISLSKWFRDYIYIPLGGSKKGVARQIFNLFVVWFLTGLWHGANFSFVVWGLIYFALLVIEKFIVKPERKSKLFRILWQMLTLLMVNLQWVIFNSKSLRSAGVFISAMLGRYAILGSKDDMLLKVSLREYGIYMLLGGVLAMPIFERMPKKILNDKRTIFIKSIGLPVCYIIIFLWAISFLILGAHNPFIYFNF